MSSHWTAPADGKPATIETVFMPEENRQTICISTQAGCAVDCRFCLTATLGLVRNLSAGEIVGQVLVALEDNRAALKPQTNIVLMGQGEPLLNYDAVMAALRILLDPNGAGDFAEARDAFDQRHRSRDRADGAGKGAAEAGDFAERVVGRAARQNHADQSEVSARKTPRCLRANTRCGRGSI